MGTKEDIETIMDFVKNSKVDDDLPDAIKRVDDWLNSPCCPLVDEGELED